MAVFRKGTIMRKCRVSLAIFLAFATSPLPVLAGKNPVHEQQAAMAREQQKMVQQQQKAMEQQQKVMQQQYQQMLRQQQQMMQQQQKALAHEQQQQQQHLKAQQARTNATATSATSAKVTAETTTTKATEATATKVKTHPTSSGVSSHGLMRWPHSSTVAYRHLMQLKRSLDAITHKSTPTTHQIASLRTSLLNVVQNSPRPPSTHVQQFSNDLATALSGRSSATVDTKDLALSLRAAMNSIHLSASEGEQTLTTAQQVLNNAGVSPAHVTTITGDIQFMANEVQASLR